MSDFTSPAKGPPRGRGKPKTKKDPKEVAADAWVTSGISIARLRTRPKKKSLNDRFKNPLVKVDIVTGEVMAFRWPAQ